MHDGCKKPKLQLQWKCIAAHLQKVLYNNLLVMQQLNILDQTPDFLALKIDVPQVGQMCALVDEQEVYASNQKR